MEAVLVENVSKYFKKKDRIIRAVQNVSFEVMKGEIFGILGPNGSGKSTLIRMIATLLIPDEGTIRIFGLDAIKDSKKVRELIHRVSTDASFFKKLSAYENLIFSAGIYGLSRKHAMKRIMELANALGFDGSRLKDPVEEFSRGMQQKTAIMRAFLTKPKLLLLDEPTTGLDPRAKREVQSLILEANRNGSTVILSTHDMEEAAKLCHRVMIIHNGRVVALGEPEKLSEALRNEKNNPTLEDVFLKYTGTSFEEADVEEVE
ncbi:MULTISPECIES: ABC transporter ATP-binding protein [Pseudothermotoga]|uniref:ABC transporter n=2 Tax=Pseudothermotoga hypogea TaxID=57487 RepID=A0A0X1KSX1_9THEM|nr:MULTISPECIES: ABC transporter ATP-binding protein [Pseudothermotoga]AJC74420.1 ABC transporter [Pseudothermotoga hypogea DSM 11164 = NBRC 106472]MBC7123366.1 ABC transporter ATP-binding protein [Pseudothermotoga sp.]MDI6861972.1 ABC transporter ATP-binding protein [Pseudothermotoga sp.]